MGVGFIMGQNQATLTSSGRPEVDQKPKGITVVHSKPTQNTNSDKTTELQKLDSLPKFWPILKSTLEYEHPLETFESGIKHEVLLTISTRYQQHLSICAETVASEQRSLTSRMKDLEMFSAGIVQQLVKRQEKINKLLPHLQRVKELSETLVKIQKSLNDCVPLVNRINMCLPEPERLDYFSLNPNVSPSRGPSLPGISPPSVRVSDSEHSSNDDNDD